MQAVRRIAAALAALAALLFGCRAQAGDLDGLLLITAADGDRLRFGLGLALLAEDHCADLRAGPATAALLHMLERTARGRGEPFDRAALEVRSRAEAQAALAGRDICAVARPLADPDGAIAPR